MLPITAMLLLWDLTHPPERNETDRAVVTSFLLSRGITRWETADHLLARRRLPDGRELQVVPLLGLRARLCVTNPHCSMSYEDVWCYDDPRRALFEMWTWDGADGTEPAGWMRHPQSRRRRPGGDPRREEIRE